MTAAESITARRSDAPSLDRVEGSELRQAYETARAALLSWQRPEGCWHGELSPSALATATAVSAFAAVSRERFAGHIGRGVAWLAAHQNADGGWGDTPESPQQSLHDAARRGGNAPLRERGSRMPRRRCEGRSRTCAPTPGLRSSARIRSLQAVYGEDLTFAAPILTNCALAPAPPRRACGGKTCRRCLLNLPACRSASFQWLKLGVVSYALPALIAVGQLRHAAAPSRNPFLRALRSATVGPALRRLRAIQPSSGGFLEATPLTSFVVMSLAGAGRSDHPVARRGLEFLSRSVRADGSWPVDTNLSHWLTSLSVAALTTGGNRFAVRRRSDAPVDPRTASTAGGHPYTGAAPGGWAWTDLSREAFPTPMTLRRRSLALRTWPSAGPGPSDGRRAARRRLAPRTFRTATADGRRSVAAGDGCPSTAARRT